MAAPDLSNLSVDDLKALQGGDMSKVSTVGLQHLSGKPVALNIPNTKGFDPTRTPTDKNGYEAGSLSDILTGPKAVLGTAELGLSGLAHGAGNIAEVLGNPFVKGGIAPNSIANKAYDPHTQMGQDFAGAIGKGTQAAATAIADKLNLSQAARDTLAERLPQAFGAVSTLLPILKAGGSVTGALSRTAVGESSGEAGSAAVARAGATPYSPPAVLTDLANEGYAVRPSDITKRFPEQDVGKVLRAQEALIGPDELAKQHIANNQVQSTRLGGLQLGMNDTSNGISYSDVAKANVAPGKVYDAVGQNAGSWKPSTTLEGELEDVAADPNTKKPSLNLIRRQVAGGNVNGSDLVEWIKTAREKGATEISDALEKELGKRLQAVEGDQGTSLADFKAARKQFAQNYLVRDSLDSPMNGQVNAAKVAKYAETHPDVQLDGPLATVAKAGAMFPEVTRLPAAGSGAPANIAGASHSIPANAIAQLTKRVPPPNQTKLMGSPTAGQSGLPPTPVLAPPPGRVGAPNAPEIPPAPVQGEMALPQGQPPFSLTPPPGAPISPMQRSFANMEPGYGREAHARMADLFRRLSNPEGSRGMLPPDMQR